MAEGGEFDPTTVDEHNTGAGWDDDDVDVDEDTSFMRKKTSGPGARPKDPYRYERIPMT